MILIKNNPGLDISWQCPFEEQKNSVALKMCAVCTLEVLTINMTQEPAFIVNLKASDLLENTTKVRPTS
jgi:hypothetical protein